MKKVFQYIVLFISIGIFSLSILLGQHAKEYLIFSTNGFYDKNTSEKVQKGSFGVNQYKKIQFRLYLKDRLDGNVSFKLISPKGEVFYEKNTGDFKIRKDVILEKGIWSYELDDTKANDGSYWFQLTGIE